MSMSYLVGKMCTKINYELFRWTLIGIGHTGNKTVAFSAVYESPKWLPKLTRERILAIAKVTATHLQKPTLYQHQTFGKAMHINYCPSK